MRFELTKEYFDTLQDAIGAEDIPWIKENVCELHEADIAAIIDELESDEAAYLYRLLEYDTQSEVLVELDEDVRERLLQTFSSKEIAGQLENLDSDDAADLIAELRAEQVEEVIGFIEDSETAEEIVDLLNYAEDTAGGMMQKEFMKARLEWPVNRCVIELRKQAEEVEKVFTIYVVDEKEIYTPFTSATKKKF